MPDNSTVRYCSVEFGPNLYCRTCISTYLLNLLFEQCRPDISWIFLVSNSTSLCTAVRTFLYCSPNILCSTIYCIIRPDMLDQTCSNIPVRTFPWLHPTDWTVGQVAGRMTSRCRPLSDIGQIRLSQLFHHIITSTSSSPAYCPTWCSTVWSAGCSARCSTGFVGWTPYLAFYRSNSAHSCSVGLVTSLTVCPVNISRFHGVSDILPCTYGRLFRPNNHVVRPRDVILPTLIRHWLYIIDYLYLYPSLMYSLTN
jgi:hypothetical protein